MRVGFTGTRSLVTGAQIAVLRRVLYCNEDFDFLSCDDLEFHHGDCIGADKVAHDIVRDYGGKIIIHPPNDPKYRAFCEGDEIREEKPYLERNHDIVDETELLLACPQTSGEVLRSGTWATLRYAKSLDRALTIVLPDGTARGTIEKL